jgi:hypothetical protein
MARRRHSGAPRHRAEHHLAEAQPGGCAGPIGVASMVINRRPRNTLKYPETSRNHH